MTQRPSVDDLRARLRDLGYLDAGVDRFVLAPVRSSRSLISGAWRASLRIGALTAVLAGPLAAATLAVRVPGLVTGARDAVVLALYLGLLFGTATAIAALVTTLVLGTLASRFGGAARLESRALGLSFAAAVIVSGACLAYLVLWWHTVSPAGMVWRSALGTSAVLAAAAVISLLLGHAVRVTTVALVARLSGGVALAIRPRRRSWPLTVSLLALAFAAASGLLLVTTRGDETAGAPATPRVTVTPTGVRLTVVAIDGLDVPFLAQLQAAGRMPALSRLLSEAQAVLPASEAGDPARTWTSLATGQPATVHGVSGIETRRVSGIEGTLPTGAGRLAGVIAQASDLLRLTRPVPTTGLQRRSKTFWEVAGEHGLSTLVVNWWATWPAPDGAGVVISDRATLRLERGGALDAEISPPSVYAALLPRWPQWRDEARRVVVEAFADADPATGAALRRAGEQDAVPLALTARLGEGDPLLRTVYLPGVDIAQYELLTGGGGAGLPASAMAARVAALERYYSFLDARVGILLAGLSPDRTVAIVTDPGRSSAKGGGLLALAGPIARRGARVQASRADVMPTLLYALGLPASRELPGRPRVELFSEEFTRRVTVREVETYGRRVVAPRPASGTPLDQEMLDRLKSLGYVR